MTGGTCMVMYWCPIVTLPLGALALEIGNYAEISVVITCWGAATL